MWTDLLDRIEKVNTRIDWAIGPETIPDYIAWDEENPAVWEHPGYINQTHDDMMNTLADDNTTKEAKHLDNERFYQTILTHMITKHRMKDLEDVYLEKWYEVCSGIFKAMGWSHSDLSSDMDETILNAWHHVETVLNEEEWGYLTSFIFKQITGKKPNITTTKGRMAFNDFTTAYNKFCAEQN